MSYIDFDHGQIDCPAKITKTAKQRYVKIEPVLKAWIEAIWQNKILSTTTIQEGNFRRRFAEVRWKAGFRTGRKHVLKPNNSGQETATPEELSQVQRRLVEWPHDCLRHSYASYHYARFGDAMTLSAQMGHETTKLLFSTYRDRVKESDAAAWWQMMPTTEVIGQGADVAVDGHTESLRWQCECDPPYCCALLSRKQPEPVDGPVPDKIEGTLIEITKE